MELSKLKHLQFYMTKFELEHIYYEQNQKIHQLTTIFHFTIIWVFETLETADVVISTANYPTMIGPIVNINFFNTFRHQNVPNQCQQFHKHTCKIQQCRSSQRLINFSITYLKQNCFAFGLNNKEVRELLIRHDEKLETCPHRVPFIIKKKASREHLI